MLSNHSKKIKNVVGDKKSSAKSKTKGKVNVSFASILDFYKPVPGTSSAADNRVLNND